MLVLLDTIFFGSHLIAYLKRWHWVTDLRPLIEFSCLFTSRSVGLLMHLSIGCFGANFCTILNSFMPCQQPMQVLPILETQDCVTQVIDLVEFALNRLAAIRFESSREDDDDDDESEHAFDASTTVAPWSRRITAVLTALHACPEDAIEGFLSAPDEGELFAVCFCPIQSIV